MKTNNSTLSEHPNRQWHYQVYQQEDWWALKIGLFFCLLALASLGEIDLVGWMSTPHTWVWLETPFAQIISASGKTYHNLPPVISLLITYVVFTLVFTASTWATGGSIREFLPAWTSLFAFTWLIWIVGYEAHFKATQQQLENLGITWGLSLGSGFAYLLALLLGLVIGNFIKPLARYLHAATKPELYIKIAIVFLGIKIGLVNFNNAELSLNLTLSSAFAVFCAYLIFWPLVYLMGRRLFHLPRSTAAVFSSGISICGVSAAIATAGALRTRPIVPAVVSIFVVTYAIIELLILPGLYTSWAPNQPMVNGAAIGLTVKTDGAAVATGAVLDELMRARALANGIHWQEGWILTTTVMTKIWLDMFIGIWAFILAFIWLIYVEKSDADTNPRTQLWQRFPKFVLGYIAIWLVYLFISLIFPELRDNARTGALPVQDPMRKMLFMLTFVSIGVLTDFSKLRGMGKLVIYYALAIFFVVAPVAYIISFVFFGGMTPPIITN